MGDREEQFSPMEIDAIGEIMNISLGSSATSVSGMLDRRVTITTPVVKILTADSFTFQALEPAIGVEINYISGLSGTNVMILKKTDVKAIVGLLLGTDYTDEEFVMDEMSISAICEVMNQMMGASSTSLSQFLNRAVNISTPETFPIEDIDEFKKKYYTQTDDIVTVSFQLIIEDLVNSEFMSVLSIDLAKEIISMFGVEEEAAAAAALQSLQQSQQEEYAPAPPQNAPAQPTGSQNAAPPPQSAPQPQYTAAPPQPQYATAPPPQYAPQPQYAPRPRSQPRMIEHMDVNMQQPVYDNFDDEVYLSEEQNNNLNMIMTIPLQVTVEIGRTKKKIKEILEFTAGTIIELSKQAGTPVDIFVNGQAVAKGDVVVVDDYYGVRITEVSSNTEILKIL